MWRLCADFIAPCEGELYYFHITLYSRMLLLCAKLTRLCTLYMLLLVISLVSNFLILFVKLPKYLFDLPFPDLFALGCETVISIWFTVYEISPPCNYDSRLGRIYPIIRVTHHSSHSIVLRPEWADLGRSLPPRPLTTPLERPSNARKLTYIHSYHGHMTGPIRI